MHGKYGDAYDQVAMAWLWSKIHLRFASRKGGPLQKEQLGYLMGSFAVYVDELERRLRDGGVDVHTGTPVQQITVDSGHASGVVLPDGTKHEADAVVAAVPSSIFKKMAPPLTPDYERRLDAVGWQFALCMVLTMKRPLSPIYWMNIPDQSMPFLALVEHTNFVGPENYGGQPHPLHLELPRAGPRLLQPERRPALGALRAGAEEDQPGVLVGLDQPALAVQGPVRAADHHAPSIATRSPTTARRSPASTSRT